MILYTSSAIIDAFLPVLGFTYSWRSFTVSLNDFLVFLCKFETAIRAATFAKSGCVVVKVAAISAASILAKVDRDRQMVDLHEQYPQYGFDKHKGYPTKVHMALLIEHGPCPFHRKTFGPVKKLL